MTDNGSGYRSHRFQAVRRQLRIRHLWTRPYTPRTNGKAERFIRTCLERWAYAAAYRNSLLRARTRPDAARLAPVLQSIAPPYGTWFPNPGAAPEGMSVNSVLINNT